MWTVLATALAFLAGMFLWGRHKEGEDVSRRLKEVGERVIKDKADAERRYKERIARAKEAAEATVADRPHTDDPVDDLRDRLDR